MNLGKAIDTLTKGTTFEKSQGQKDIDASMVKAGVKTEEEVTESGRRLARSKSVTEIADQPRSMGHLRNCWSE